MFSFHVVFCNRKFHLVEAVREIISVFSEFLFPLLDEPFSDFFKERRIRREHVGIEFIIETTPFQVFELYIGMLFGKSHRHETCKGRCYRLHSQFAHAVNDLML